MAAKATSSRRGQRLDWSLTPRGPVSAVALAASGLAATASVGHVADLHPIWGAAGTGVGLLGAVLAGAHRDVGPGGLLYRMACWAGAGSWLTWTLADAGPWHVNELAALAVGAVGAGMLSPLAKPRRAGSAARGAPGTALAVRPAGQVGVAWEARFRRVCQVAVRVTDVHRWDNGAGYDLVCDLPPGPATRKRIAACADALAADARLPEGCGVEIRKGDHRGGFVASVTTTNRLAETIPYPADYSPRSILDPVELGEHRDTSIAGVLLREDSMLITGRKRGGKTNLLDVLTLGIGRCRDALVWHIDLNGGGMSQLWLHPWLEGEVDRPPIDWAAPTPQEALLMTTVALEIARHRKTAYRQLKARSNAKLLPISRDLPEIVIMIDEAAEVLCPTNTDPTARRIRANIEEIQRIAGNEAVNVIVSSLRPTQDMISPQILKQSAAKVAVHGLDDADIGHLHGWHCGVTADDLPTKGCASLGVGSEPPRPLKAWFLEPEQIRQAAAAIAQIRPDLDPASQHVANGEIRSGGRSAITNAYADRYQRMRAAFTGQDLAIPEPAAEAPQAPAETTGRPDLRALPGGIAASWPDPPTSARRATAPIAGTASAWPDPPMLRRRTTTPVAIDMGRIPEIITRAIEAMRAADDTRMHSETLAEALGYGTERDDVLQLAADLAEYEVRPRPKFMRGGRDRRGYWLEDLEAVARAYAAGRTPAAVASGEADADDDSDANDGVMAGVR